MSNQDSSQSEDIEQRLLIHEWMAIAALIGLLVLLTTFAFLSVDHPSVRVDPPHYAVDPEIDVFVEGAVEHPGKHRIKRGSLVKDVLAVARPLQDADLNRIKPESKVHKGRVIRVPYITSVIIYLEGAVKTSGQLLLPRGSRLRDLTSSIQFQEGANLRHLNKKRLLKDFEVITVPFLEEV